MNTSNENSPSSETIGWHPLGQTLSSVTGMPLGAIGLGKPLPVSAELSQSRPMDTDHRLLTCLERISGQPPATMTRMYFPNEGTPYSMVSEVRWKCPPDALVDCATAIEGAFRSAPEDRIASALFQLRMLTRAREQRTEAMMEAEALVWIEQLRCWPGDIVLDVLKRWSTLPQGEWWPTWHEIQHELKRGQDKRMALANFIRTAMQGHISEIPVLGVQSELIPDERRAEIVEEAWQSGLRSEWRPKPKPLTETELMAITERNRITVENPLQVGHGLARKLEDMKKAVDNS